MNHCYLVSDRPLFLRSQASNVQLISCAKIPLISKLTPNQCFSTLSKMIAFIRGIKITDPTL